MPASSQQKPQGQLAIPAMLCGVAGAVLGIVLDAVDLFKGMSDSLEKMYQAEPFLMGEASTWHQAWDWLLAIALSIGVAYAVMDSRGTWRRVLIIVFALSLIALASPVLVLWNIFWFPVLLLCAVAWAWLGAFVYASQHQMPCDLESEVATGTQPEKVVVETVAEVADVNETPSSIAEKELLEVQKDEIINEDKFKPKANA